ncbi:MAG TPA: MBL fold metallo-hydrolase [Dehalococcoidia bacterium]|nr:MBL fold metallo-hydrolase [Dehalococcoidia bacterium]
MNRPDQEQPARYRIGAIELAVVSDGTVYQDAGAIMGVVPRTVWEPVIGTPTEKNLTAVPLNVLVVRSSGRTVIVDTGVGNKLDERQRTVFFPGDYGHLLRRLKRIGVQPEDVDAVVNTHLHFDHCGWNTANLHGVPLPTFPRATYYIARGEYQAATHPNERTRPTYIPENFVPLEESGRLALVEGEQEIAPGVRVFPTPGHTEDHQSVAVRSGGEWALYTGDLAQHAVQLERDAWIAAFDVLPLVSLQTKKDVLGRALRERALVFSPHAVFPGAGYLELDGSRRKFVPAPPLHDEG